MSRATAAVRFEDGTVKWCLYNGTSDVLVPKLYNDPISAWDGYYDEAVDNWEETSDQEDPNPVIIYSDYGWGFWWEGTAYRDRVVGPIDIYNGEIEVTRGRPNWFSEAYQRDQGNKERTVTTKKPT